MEVKRVLRLQVVVVVLLLAGLNGARAVEKYFMEGGNMVLEPKVTATITNILWKHKGNLLAEWVKDAVNLTYYDTFDGRTKLSIITGRLGITKMTKDDVGAYTLEINSKVHGESYTAKMIKAVPDPSVWIQPVACTRESPSCSLLCEGRTPEGATEDTTEAEPITYSWRRDEGEWSPPKKDDKEMMINKDTAGTENFSCRMENPVSTKQSQPRANPFYVPPPPPPPPYHLIGGIVGGGLAVLALVGIFIGYRKRDTIKAKFSRAPPSDNTDANGSPKTDAVNVPLNQSPNTDDVTATA